MEGIKAYAMSALMTYVPKVLLALVVLLVGFWLVKKLLWVTNRHMEKRGVDKTLRPFLLTLIGIFLKLLIVISVASMVGIATTSFVAVLAAAGLAIGLALQGSLSNFAGGILILLFKPIKEGDFIEAQGQGGTVKEIQLFSTILTTPDNKTVIVPNSLVSNSLVINYSVEPLRRVDLTFGVSYSDDIAKVKGLIEKSVASEQRILDDPKPLIRVTQLADNSVNLATRVWVKREDYWEVYYNMQEGIKQAFDEAGVTIPFPQMDVRVAK